MNSSAKFLVLVGSAPRAVLFDSDQQPVGEVIEDDGFIVDSLLRNATMCALPTASRLVSSLAASALQSPVRCFELV